MVDIDKEEIDKLNQRGFNIDIKIVSTVKDFIYNNKVDSKKYRAIKVLNLAKKLDVNGYIVINVLNELLVEKFLDKKISFSDIIYKLLSILQSKIVKKYLKYNKIKHIKDVFKTYEFCRSILNW